MTQHGYEAGAWWALVAPTGTIAVPPDAAPELVDALWTLMHEQATMGAIVDALTAHAGGVLSAVPAFAAVTREGADARVAVRGRVSVRVRSAEGELTFTGAEVTTWSERFVPRAEAAELLLDDAGPARLLPVVGGVVGAARVVFAMAATEGESAAPQPDDADSGPPVVAEQPDVDEYRDADEQSEVVEQPNVVAQASAVEHPESGEHASATEHTLVSAATLAPSVDSSWSDSAGAEGDHDGATISLAQLRAVREDSGPAGSDPASEAVSGPRIRLSTGQVVALDQTVIIGRRPRATRASSESMPHLIAVDSPQHDISRSHLEVRLEPGACIAVDLHTTNGSTLLRGSADPVRLHPGEHTVVVSGDVIDLGDGITVTFEELP